MQKLSACRNRAWPIQRFFSTSSVCMIAICPAGSAEADETELEPEAEGFAKTRMRDGPDGG